jgi:hypothetical protein
MRLKALLLALFALGLTASVALSAPPSKGKPGVTTNTTSTSTTTTTTHGKKPATTGAHCKPKVKVVLNGILASAPGAGGTSFTLTVAKTNKAGKAYKPPHAQPVTIAVDSKTTFKRNNSKSEASLLVGDRVQVQARACKADLAHSATPALLAVHVVAHPPATAAETTTTTS